MKKKKRQYHFRKKILQIKQRLHDGLEVVRLPCNVVLFKLADQ